METKIAPDNKTCRDCKYFIIYKTSQDMGYCGYDKKLRVRDRTTIDSPACPLYEKKEVV